MNAASSFEGHERRPFKRPMLKILRSATASTVVFTLSGRIKADHLAELAALFDAEDQAIVLELKEVTLVDRDTIAFLARCEGDGVELKNCPAYVREWIERETHRK